MVYKRQNVYTNRCTYVYERSYNIRLKAQKFASRLKFVFIDKASIGINRFSAKASVTSGVYSVYRRKVVNLLRNSSKPTAIEWDYFSKSDNFIQLYGEEREIIREESLSSIKWMKTFNGARIIYSGKSESKRKKKYQNIIRIIFVHV